MKREEKEEIEGERSEKNRLFRLFRKLTSGRASLSSLLHFSLSFACTSDSKEIKRENNRPIQCYAYTHKKKMKTVET